MQELLVKKRPLIGIGVCVIDNGKVLLGKRKGSHCSGYWGFAGGHLEFGETIFECAKRELLEETGLFANQLKMGPWTNDIMIEDDKHYITFFVYATQIHGELSILEPEKCECWKWYEWDHLPCPLFSPVRSLIKEVGIDQLKKIE